MSKIKYYKNIKLEEFLDESIEECAENQSDETITVETDYKTKTTTVPNLEILLDNDDSIDIEIVESDELESDITFEITKDQGEKKLVLTVNIYDDSEIIKLDFEIKKSTLKKLLKDLED